MADASPLHYLILIGGVDLLAEIFLEVIVPDAVLNELASPGAPPQVSRWMAARPSWIKVAKPRLINQSMNLDPGETEAICLAVERGIETVLMDERKGRSTAARMGLRTIGTLALVERFAREDWLDFDEAIGQLKTSSFGCTTLRSSPRGSA